MDVIQLELKMTAMKKTVETFVTRCMAMSVCLALVMTGTGFIASCDRQDDEEPAIEEHRGQWNGVMDEDDLTTDDLLGMLAEVAPEIANFNSILRPYFCDIHIAKIKYLTEDQNGKLIETSGIVSFPTGKYALKEYSHILSIQHGTADINSGPTDQRFFIESSPVLSGEVIVCADYLGYGISKTADRKHTYFHDRTTGTACADMIEAARQYLKTRTEMVCTADSIRLIGYSQGGQATMATLFELQRLGHGKDISLVWSGGGPHDLMHFLSMYMDYPDDNYPRLGYIPYVIEGIINGEGLDIDRHNIYAPEMFENGKDSIFTRSYVSEWHEIVGHDIKKVINSDFFKAPDYGGNADIAKLIEALERNSTVNAWNHIDSNIKVHLFHVPGDTYVPYECSVIADREWGDSSDLTDLSYASNHPTGGAEFILRYMGLINVFAPILPLIENLI